jgi:hypothetical protein
MGGLGNQLFQIFTTISYALKNNHSFFFTNEKYLGGQYNNRETYWDSFLYLLKKYTADKSFFHADVYFKESGFRYNRIPDAPSEPNNIKITGYFQSPKYFKDHYEVISNLILLKKQKKYIYEKYISYFSLFKNMISMHFRMGDYKHLPNYHPIMNLEYYEKSINKIIDIRKTNYLKIIYFCEKEDIEDVKLKIELLKDKFPRCIFEYVDYDIPDWEQLLLMSCCKDNIIANSTFSWWGAYFNNNMDKIVCYPNKWFGSHIQHNGLDDLFPEDWHKIV